VQGPRNEVPHGLARGFFRADAHPVRLSNPVLEDNPGQRGYNVAVIEVATGGGLWTSTGSTCVPATSQTVNHKKETRKAEEAVESFRQWRFSCSLREREHRSLPVPLFREDGAQGLVETSRS